MNDTRPIHNVPLPHSGLQKLQLLRNQLELMSLLIAPTERNPNATALPDVHRANLSWCLEKFVMQLDEVLAMVTMAERVNTAARSHDADCE